MFPLAVSAGLSPSFGSGDRDMDEREQALCRESSVQSRPRGPSKAVRAHAERAHELNETMDFAVLERTSP